MWNFRAYEEREFYRIDHMTASMGVLCHLNYSEELANGVAITTDPIYQTDNTYYLNSQLGEDLVTNPESYSMPEEILIDAISLTEDDFRVVRYSNLLGEDTLVMDTIYLDLLREYLGIIHHEFASMYEVQDLKNFAMDVEYKINSAGQLIIKQARPWASFWSNLEAEEPITMLSQPARQGLLCYPNPTQNELKISGLRNLDMLLITDLPGRPILAIDLYDEQNSIETNLNLFPEGIYLIKGLSEEGEVLYIQRIIKS